MFQFIFFRGWGFQRCAILFLHLLCTLKRLMVQHRQCPIPLSEKVPCYKVLLRLLGVVRGATSRLTLVSLPKNPPFTLFKHIQHCHFITYSLSPQITAISVQGQKGYAGGARDQRSHFAHNSWFGQTGRPHQWACPIVCTKTILSAGTHLCALWELLSLEILLVAST